MLALRGKKDSITSVVDIDGTLKTVFNIKKGSSHYTLRMTNSDLHVGGIKIKLLARLMSEEGKIKREKMTDFQ